MLRLHTTFLRNVERVFCNYQYIDSPIIKDPHKACHISKFIATKHARELNKILHKCVKREPQNIFKISDSEQVETFLNVYFSSLKMCAT